MLEIADIADPVKTENSIKDVLQSYGVDINSEVTKMPLLKLLGYLTHRIIHIKKELPNLGSADFVADKIISDQFGEVINKFGGIYSNPL